MKKVTLLKVLFAGTVSLALAGGLCLANRQSDANSLNFKLEENQVLAAVASESAQGTCCDGGTGQCIIGTFVMNRAYLKADDGKPCP